MLALPSQQNYASAQYSSLPHTRQNSRTNNCIDFHKLLPKENARSSTRVSPQRDPTYYGSLGPRRANQGNVG